VLHVKNVNGYEKLFS